MCAMRVVSRADGTVYEIDTLPSGPWSVGHDPETGEPVFTGIPDSSIRIVAAPQASTQGEH